MKKILALAFLAAITVSVQAENIATSNNSETKVILEEQFKAIQNIIDQGKKAGLTPTETLKLVAEQLESKVLADDEESSSSNIKQFLFWATVAALAAGGIYVGYKLFFEKKVEADTKVEAGTEEKAKPTSANKKKKRQKQALVNLNEKESQNGENNKPNLLQRQNNNIPNPWEDDPEIDEDGYLKLPPIRILPKTEDQPFPSKNISIRCKVKKLVDGRWSNWETPRQFSNIERNINLNETTENNQNSDETRHNIPIDVYLNPLNQYIQNNYPNNATKVRVLGYLVNDISIPQIHHRTVESTKNSYSIFPPN